MKVPSFFFKMAGYVIVPSIWGPETVKSSVILEAILGIF